MAKGAILDDTLLQALGLTDQVFTLRGPILNIPHPQLQEPVFHLQLKEIEETVFLERSYVFANQVSIKSNLGEGERLLLWISRQSRPDPADSKLSVRVLLARECFLLSDWREFQRFKGFVKSTRILDAQARQWLEEHHREFPTLATSVEGIERVLANLSRISDWPDLDAGALGERVNVLERIAKTYSAGLAPIRATPLLPALLMRRDPQERFTLFRLFSYVEDPNGAAALVHFLSTLAHASKDSAAIDATRSLTTSRDLSRAFSALRAVLLKPTVAT